MMAKQSIGAGEAPFIIAEAGSNHDGKLGQAKELIDVAVEAGADAVKFQLFRADWLYPEEVGTVDTPAGEIDFFAFLKSAEVPLDWLETLAGYSRSKGILFLLSVFDEQTADALDRIDVPAYKIASPELNHIPLLEYVARKGRPILISTGASHLSDIDESLRAVYRQGNGDVVLLHCVTSYPTPPEHCNLRMIETLKQAFDVPVGLSDHTVEAEAAPSIAVALGASVIEKHFTLDKSLPGPDHPFALEPDELTALVCRLREIAAMSRAGKQRLIAATPNATSLLGSPVKQVTQVEADYHHWDRRSLHAIRDIGEGEALTDQNVRILRSEKNLTPGLHPRYWRVVCGKRATAFVPKGNGIQWHDLLAS